MATAILRYASDYGAPPADKTVTLDSGKYTFTSDALPELTYGNTTFYGWTYDGEMISVGDVLHADDGEVIELRAYWAAEPVVVAEEGTVEERAYLGREGLRCYDGNIRAYIDRKSDAIAENVAYIDAEDNENVEVDGVIEGGGNTSKMQGASANNSGVGGTVPAPSAGQQNAVLHGDGTWREVELQYVVNLTMNDEGTAAETDKTADEVIAAYLAGKNVVYSNGSTKIPVIGAQKGDFDVATRIIGQLRVVQDDMELVTTLYHAFNVAQFDNRYYALTPLEM